MVSASTQNQALNASVFISRKVLRRDPGDFGEFDRVNRPKRLAVGLTKEEVRRVLVYMEGTHGRMARLWASCDRGRPVAGVETNCSIGRTQ
jgi:hypothetical protein